MKHHVSRRDFLRLSSGAFVALHTSNLLRLTPNSSPHLQAAPIPDLEINLTAAPVEIDIFDIVDGTPRTFWRYQGEVLQGDPAALQTRPGSYLGPTIRVRRGQRLIVHFINNLPEES